MHVHEFVDEELGHSSYLIDLGDGTAAVVDPPRFPTEHEALIDQSGWALRWTIDTHSHADYVTGSPGLVARRGVTFIAPSASNLETPHHGVSDGEQVTLAPGVVLTAIATPGHTPDHHAYVLEVDRAPVALFTDGSLMVGTVGRTDLCGPELAVPLAHEMFRSLHRFDDLPDTVPVYPTHGAGSFRSAPGAAERTSTLGPRADHEPPAVDPRRDRSSSVVAGSDVSSTSSLPESTGSPARYDDLPRSALTADGRAIPAFVERLVDGFGTPATFPGRSRTRCARCSARGSAGSSPPAAHLRARPRAGPPRPCAAMPRRRSRTLSRRARRRHRRMGVAADRRGRVTPAHPRRRRRPSQRVRGRPHPRRHQRRLGSIPARRSSTAL